MTDASGKPYVGGAGNGSMASVATSGSVTSTASPLRSSLKKPKPLGIHNPGFSAHSPTLSRNGSQKKVRIQTHSTETENENLQDVQQRLSGHASLTAVHGFFQGVFLVHEEQFIEVQKHKVCRQTSPKRPQNTTQDVVELVLLCCDVEVPVSGLEMCNILSMSAVFDLENWEIWKLKGDVTDFEYQTPEQN
ncbi:hypothetical protein WN51_13940 [Melipona quadrifasciata]|uniref:Uncharacterized protein n=1 Tax=Melipona quadrifasciata TaxID=166423 RepID=A0A0N0BFU9_9HYME|nr:hypothetical protein WN51_13940 [Melipona quadrifasciata]